MSTGYQNIDNQAQVYTPAPAQPSPYLQDQESLYTGPTSYGSSTTNDTSNERPALLSFAGIVMIWDCFVMFLSWICAFITLILLKGGVARIIVGKIVGVNPINAGFIAGYISFLNLFFPAVVILSELHFPFIVEKAPFVKNHLVKAGFYVFFTFINLGFAGNFGVAVGTFMLLSAALNIGCWFINRQ